MFFVSTSNITKLFDKNNSYSFEYQKNSYFILGCAAVVQEGNIRKTMAARGLVNGRGPRSGRDLVFRCYPPELLLTPQKKKLTFWVSLFSLRFPIRSGMTFVIAGLPGNLLVLNVLESLADLSFDLLAELYVVSEESLYSFASLGELALAVAEP